MNGKDNLFYYLLFIHKQTLPLVSIHQVQIATTDIILYVNQRILCCPGISFSPVTDGHSTNIHPLSASMWQPLTTAIFFLYGIIRPKIT